MRNYEFKADIEGWSIQGYDQGGQWDTDSNQLEFSIYRRGKVTTEYDGGSVVATILRDSDKAQIITNTNIEGNKASIVIPNNAFYYEGDRLTIQFTINKDSQQLTIADKMFIEVVGKLVGEDVEDDDRLPILDQKIIEVEELSKDLERLEETYDARLVGVEDRIDNPRFDWLEVKKDDSGTDGNLEIKRSNENLWYYIGNRISEKWLRFKDSGILQWTGEMVASKFKVGNNEVYHEGNLDPNVKSFLEVERGPDVVGEGLELKRNEENLWYYIGNRISEKWLRFKDNGVLQWTGKLDVNDDVSVDGTITSSGINTTADNMSIINRPQGGTCTWSGVDQRGAIAIVLPQSYTSTMLSMVVDIFNYSTGQSFSVLISGYNYEATTQWYNCTATVMGGTTTDRNFNVRFGNNGTKTIIWIGEVDSVWSYPKIVVRDVIASHHNYEMAKWSKGWDIRLDSTMPKVDVTLSKTQLGKYVDNNLVWHDGLGAISKTSNGYTKLPNGLILQWGTHTYNSDGDVSVTLPIAFPSAFLGSWGNFPVSYTGTYTIYTRASGLDKIVLNRSDNTNDSQTVKWLAIGY